jgi:hypothetical protein
MSAPTDVRRLRRQVAALARRGRRDGLDRRYPLVFELPARLSPYRRFRIYIGGLLRRWGLRRTLSAGAWCPALKHARYGDAATPILIWALGIDRTQLRAACRAFLDAEETRSDIVPILVTDVADFAFFSRLGWLVEYVPALSPPAAAYSRRKAQYLAWRYRDAAVLPASLLLSDESAARTLIAAAGKPG